MSKYKNSVANRFEDTIGNEWDLYVDLIQPAASETATAKSAQLKEVEIEG